MRQFDQVISVPTVRLFSEILQRSASSSTSQRESRNHVGVGFAEKPLGPERMKSVMPLAACPMTGNPAHLAFSAARPKDSRMDEAAWKSKEYRRSTSRVGATVPAAAAARTAAVPSRSISSGPSPPLRRCVQRSSPEERRMVRLTVARACAMSKARKARWRPPGTTGRGSREPIACGPRCRLGSRSGW